MIADPRFPLLEKLHADIRAAGTDVSLAEDVKEGAVIVDGVLHPLASLKAPVSGAAAYAFGVGEPALNTLCDLVDVEALGFKGLRTTDLSPFQRMPRLRRLDLCWVQKASDVSPLADLKQLRVLRLDDVAKAHDLSPLSELQKLNALYVGGNMWKDQVVETLEPLSRIIALKELQLGAVKTLEGGLRPLARCRSLTDLGLSVKFDVEDYAYLKAKLPGVRSNAFQAWRPCRPIDDKDAMVVGKRKPFLNQAKDAARLRRYEQAFEALVERHRGDG